MLLNIFSFLMFSMSCRLFKVFGWVNWIHEGTGFGECNLVFDVDIDDAFGGL